MATSSIVSYSRVPITQILPGLRHVIYDIPVSDGVEPNVLHVEDSFYTKLNALDTEDVIYVSSEQIVNSLVNMHINSQIIRAENAHPGIFAIPGIKVMPSHFKGSDEVSQYVQNLASKAKIAQRNWFLLLVEMADNDYAQYGRPSVVSQLQKLAARELNLKRPWNVELLDEGAKPECPFCATGLLNANAPVCPNCKNVINQAKFDELQARVRGMLEGPKVNLENVPTRLDLSDLTRSNA